MIRLFSAYSRTSCDLAILLDSMFNKAMYFFRALQIFDFRTSMANGCKDEQTKSMVFLSASDDEDENKEDLGEFESKSSRSSVVIDLSSDEVDFIADRRIRAVEMAVEAEEMGSQGNELAFILELELYWQEVDFMRREEPSETITTVDTEADGILESAISAKESSETVTTADMETGMLDSFVKTKELLEKIETMDNDATGTSAWKNEEDLEEFENKSFPSAAFIDLLSSSSDEVEFVSNWRESRDALSAAADMNKKKKKSKKKNKKKIEAERVGCTKPHGERSAALPTLCYRFGEDGHLLRG
ncbi:hypothetical protein MRB53_018437 [Persea americana]|uniref:Uncharacterized protein n=1 Tax=Persea americana TaxID=3435 RepID=A0ACC2M8H8_PERAE|nr:hypothetical protein MRB53_018437 [Persea americana]